MLIFTSYLKSGSKSSTGKRMHNVLTSGDDAATETVNCYMFVARMSGTARSKGFIRGRYVKVIRTSYSQITYASFGSVS